MPDALARDELNRIKGIVDSRLIRVPSEAKLGFPAVLLEPHVSYLAFSTSKYFMLALFDDIQKQRILELTERGYHPFPGLIAEDGEYSVAFTLTDSRNTLLQGNVVRDLVALSLGEDSSVVLIDHRQSITTDQLGLYGYVVQLAYILSYGKQITRENISQSLEDLVAYSINAWGKSDSRTSHQ